MGRAGVNFGTRSARPAARPDSLADTTPRALASQASHTNHATWFPGVTSAAPSRAHATCVKTRHASHSTQPRGKSAERAEGSFAEPFKGSDGLPSAAARRSASATPSLAHATPPKGEIAHALETADAGGFAGASCFVTPSSLLNAPGRSSFAAVSSRAEVASFGSFATPGHPVSGGRRGGARPHCGHAATFRSCGWSRS